MRLQDNWSCPHRQYLGVFERPLLEVLPANQRRQPQLESCTSTSGISEPSLDAHAGTLPGRDLILASGSIIPRDENGTLHQTDISQNILSNYC